MSYRDFEEMIERESYVKRKVHAKRFVTIALLSAAVSSSSVYFAVKFIQWVFA